MTIIKTYDDAVKFHDRIKPLRTTGIRHLDHRSSRSNQYVEKTSLGAVKFVLYSTPCVVYHPDGIVELTTGGFSSKSTTEFIHAYSPFTCRRENCAVRISAVGGSYAVGRAGLRIKDGVALNPKLEYQTILNKKTAAEIRNKFKPIIDEVKNITKVFEPTRELYREYARKCFGLSLISLGAMLREDRREEALALLLCEAINEFRLYDGWQIKEVIESVYMQEYRAGGAIQQHELPAGVAPKRTKWD